MSLSTFLGKLKQDAVNFEHVAVVEEQKAVTWLSHVFGPQNVDNAVTAIEQAAQTELGALTQKAVLFAEDVLGSGAGATKASMVLNLVSTAAGALGIPFSTGAVNALINLFASFVGSAASAVVATVVQPAK